VTKTYSDEPFINLASGGEGSAVITYQSSDENIAVVDADSGEVTILSVGNVTITATKAADDNYLLATADYNLLIGKIEIGIVFDGIPEVGFELVLGGKNIKIPVPKLYNIASNQPIEWSQWSSEFDVYDRNLIYQMSTSNEGVANISDYYADHHPYDLTLSIEGVVGETVVTFSTVETANFQAASSSFNVNVRDGQSDFIFEETTDIIAELSTVPFTNIAQGGHGQNITYTSGNPAVASVDRSTGQVTIHSVGQTTISAVNQGQGSLLADFSSYKVIVNGEKPETATIMSWTGAEDSEISITRASQAIKFISAINSTCDPESLENCGDVIQGDITETAQALTNTNLSQNSTLWLNKNESTEKFIDLTSARFAPRTCASKVVFKGRIWLIGGTIEEDLWNSGNLNDNSNEIWSSLDGIDWKLENSSAEFLPLACSDVFVFNEQLWLIKRTGDEAHLTEIWQSENGKDWQEVQLTVEVPARYYMTPVVFNNELYLYISNSEYSDRGLDVIHQIWHSSNGSSWQQVVNTPQMLLSPFVFKDQMMSFSAGYVWSSTDGEEWNKDGQTLHNITDVPTLHNDKLWLRKSYGGYDHFFPYAEILSSVDGVTWENERQEGTIYHTSDNFLGDAQLLSFKNKLWMVGPNFMGYYSRNSNVVYNSIDGRTWTKFSDEHKCSIKGYRGDNCSYVAYQNKFWQVDDNRLYASADGLNWETVTENLLFDEDAPMSVFNDLLWAFQNGKSWSSSDGINWQLQSQDQLFSTKDYQTVHPYVINNEILLVTSAQNSKKAYWRSFDGKDWRFIELGQNDPLLNTKIIHNNKVWNVINEAVSYSADGIEWQAVEALPHEYFQLVSFNNQLWALGRNYDELSGKGTYLQSLKLNDEGKWQVIAAQTTIAYSDFSWRKPIFREKNNQLYFFSSFDLERSLNNSVWRSNDAINWRLGKLQVIPFSE